MCDTCGCNITSGNAAVQRCRQGYLDVVAAHSRGAGRICRAGGMRQRRDAEATAS